MSGVQRIAGRGIVVMRSDVDTDQIIPAHWLKKVERTGFGPGLFEAWRKDPGFALNQPGADEARTLISGPNFGCGSSREHAVWALLDFGFEAVVAPSFADIFRGNAISAGLVPAQVSEDAAARLAAALEEKPDAEVVVGRGRSHHFRGRRGNGVVRTLGLCPVAAAQGARRRRPHAAARGRHRCLRGWSSSGGCRCSHHRYDHFRPNLRRRVPACLVQNVMFSRIASVSGCFGPSVRS